MIIKNVKVFKENGIFENGEIYIQGENFVENCSDDVVIDGNGCYAIPGLTDLHFHGCVGYDFCDGNE